MKISYKALNINSDFVVTIDGPSASGKSSIGKKIAETFHLVYYSSGLLYRKLAFLSIQNNLKKIDVTSVIKMFDLIHSVKDVNLYDSKVTLMSSKIAILPDVRSKINIELLEILKKTPRIIMEGRDIGTVIAPNADLKIFITADLNTRAERRLKQFSRQNKTKILSNVISELEERDNQDILRETSPLTIPRNAFQIDTSNLSEYEVLKKIEDFIKNV